MKALTCERIAEMTVAELIDELARIDDLTMFGQRSGSVQLRKSRARIMQEIGQRRNAGQPGVPTGKTLRHKVHQAMLRRYTTGAGAATAACR